MIITKSAHITKNLIRCNSREVFSQENDNGFTEFIKSAFKQICPAYPKFYKMDSLSKLAFVASEVLLKDTNLLSNYAKEDIGLLFLNNASTINTDNDHQKSISDRQNYFPSPSVFVYTLPNIMLGEICIKNQFFGENAVFITSEFDAEMLVSQVTILAEKKRIEACICGWADIEDDNYEAFLLLTENKTMLAGSEEICKFAALEINKLYNNK
ncbi:MAG: hypothetical protein PHR81_02650 [Bacteroidales bacterium]|jgi:hypothetical protein|nr:hypothetical protein [Bacteroidales bacterium]MDD4213688.1 hypothetical protein [Bacteroidales bacterium]